MYKINTKGYEKKEKVVIAETSTSKIKEQVKFTEDAIPRASMEYIIEKLMEQKVVFTVMMP